MPAMKHFLAVAFIVLAAGAAFASGIVEEYSDAMKTARSGDPAGAVRTLEGLLEKYPGDKLAEDILFQIGQIQERYLFDYEAAKASYKRLMERYPRSRQIRRAEASLERLNRGESTGTEALKEYNAILQGYSNAGSKVSLSKMETFSKEHPDFVYADKVWMFIAQGHNRAKDYKGAIAAYQLILDRYPGEGNAERALAAIGGAYAEMRDLREARAAFNRLKGMSGSPEAASVAAEDGLRRVHEFEVLRYLFIASLILLGIFVLFIALTISWKEVSFKAATKIWPEILVLTAVLGAVFLLVRARGPIFSRSVLFLWIASTFLITCNNLYIQTRRFSKYNSIAFGIVALLASVALCFAVFHLTDLANLLWDSLRYEMEFGKK